MQRRKLLKAAGSSITAAATVTTLGATSASASMSGRKMWARGVDTAPSPPLSYKELRVNVLEDDSISYDAAEDRVLNIKKLLDLMIDDDKIGLEGYELTWWNTDIGLRQDPLVTSRWEQDVRAYLDDQGSDLEDTEGVHITLNDRDRPGATDVSTNSNDSNRKYPHLWVRDYGENYSHNPQGFVSTYHVSAYAARTLMRTLVRTDPDSPSWYTDDEPPGYYYTDTGDEFELGEVAYKDWYYFGTILADEDSDGAGLCESDYNADEIFQPTVNLSSCEGALYNRTLRYFGNKLASNY